MAHWSDEIAQKIIDTFPDREKYVCAAGITPSGMVHIGNLRDVITSELVVRALKDKGKNAELIWSWDDYDRFRKVPKDIPPEYEKYLGLPLTKIPDPFGCHDSYARHREVGLEGALPQIGIDARIIRQSEMYEKNAYFELMKTALQKRKEIAKILFSMKAQEKTKEDIENYYPFNVYCGKCGKDTTWITNYDGNNLVTYECSCGFSETVDISKKNIGKLAWRVDWPMRWKYENVSFEPAGRDHSSAGGSADISPLIAREIFNIEPPVYQGYEWNGITGGTHKMSGSTGEGFTTEMLLEIYEPEIIRWFFTRVKPEQKFDFALNDQIIKNYSEWDEFLKKAKEGALDEDQERVLELSQISSDKNPEPGSVSFRQLASFAQIAKGNVEILKTIIENAGAKISERDIKERLPRAIAWTENYAPEEYRIKLLEKPNVEFFESIQDETRENIIKLVANIDDNWSIEGLTNLIYDIPKKDGLNEQETKTAQREFFKLLYRLLCDKDTGPRLPVFLMAIGRDKTKKLISIEN